MKFIKIFAALVGLSFVFVFCSSNDTKVTLNFLEYSTPETYLFLYVLSAFVLGMITASFASTIKIMQLKRQINKLLTDSGVAPDKEKKKNKKEKKEEVQPEVETSATITAKKPEAAVVPPVVTPAAETVTDIESEVSDAVFEDEGAVDAPEEATPQVIELPHDNNTDVSPSDKN